MLPGTLGNDFSPDEMQIPLQPLIEQAGADLILDDVISLDSETSTIYFASHSPVTFDALSVGIGSVPAGWDKFDSPNIVPIKPMQTFIDRFDHRFKHCEKTLGHACSVTIVGGGVAGVELAFCVQKRMSHHFSNDSVQIRIVTSGDEIAGGMSKHSRRVIRRLMSERSIDIITGFHVTSTTDDTVLDQDGRSVSADVVLWATQATAPPILNKLGLPVDGSGFLATEPNLKTIAKDRPIFAVGDCGTIIADPAPKAGVYAVRQAPVLWHNLQATLRGESLNEFHPQKGFLKILNTGDGKALLQYHGISFHARWCWKLKSWIDKSFVRKFKNTKN